MTLLQQALGSIVRWALAFLAGYLVSHGVWTPGAAESYVNAAATAIAMAVVSLGWSLWQKYRARLRLLTALDMPAGTSEAKVEDRIKAGGGVTPL